MSLLTKYGWTSLHSGMRGHQLGPEACPARVISIAGHKYIVVADRGELDCELSGKLQFGANTEDLPKVGDWITFIDYGDTGIITSVLVRKNALVRKRPGNAFEKQILAANIDGALIVQSPDANFSLMRLERYIVQILACGIEPIVVLNKVDLVEDVGIFEAEIASLKRKLSLISCSTVSGTGLQRLQQRLAPTMTYILVGSSGVGKSSLLNALLQKDFQTTGNISRANLKGRHTTTKRDLFLLPNGSLVIDTPGMREFGVTNESDTDHLFPVIDSFGARCRFANCTHTEEPGCAVLEALEEGSISHEVYASYVKLMKEQKRFQIRAEDKKRLNRQFGKLTREAKAYRKRNKF